jgi:hypothetical protein
MNSQKRKTGADSRPRRGHCELKGHAVATGAAKLSADTALSLIAA